MCSLDTTLSVSHFSSVSNSLFFFFLFGDSCQNLSLSRWVSGRDQTLCCSVFIFLFWPPFYFLKFVKDTQMALFSPKKSFLFHFSIFFLFLAFFLDEIFSLLRRRRKKSRSPGAFSTDKLFKWECFLLFSRLYG